MKCGNTWYSSRDAISSLVIKTSASPPNVGVAPWATSKFDEVEKDLQADHVPAAPSTETKSSPRDTKGSPTPPPHHHYEEVENILHEHLSVANPTVEEFVNTNPQPAVATTEEKLTPSPKTISETDTENGKSRPPPPEVTTDSRSELEISHVDGVTGSFLPENSAANGTSHPVGHKA